MALKEYKIGKEQRSKYPVKSISQQMPGAHLDC